MTVDQKAEDLAYRYFTMAKNHVKRSFPGVLVDITDERWNPDTPYRITPNIRRKAKYHAAFFAAETLLKDNG
jgi:hypothetical protein